MAAVGGEKGKLPSIRAMNNQYEQRLQDLRVEWPTASPERRGDMLIEADRIKEEQAEAGRRLTIQELKQRVLESQKLAHILKSQRGGA